MESNDEAQDPDNAETPVKSPKKAPKERPKVLEEDASYKLFVAVILDRHAMSKVLASCVKDLKVAIVFRKDAFVGSVPTADDGDLPEQPEGEPCDRTVDRPGRVGVLLADPR